MIFRSHRLLAITLSRRLQKLIEHLGGSPLAKRPTPTSKGLKRMVFSLEISMDILQMEKAYLSHMALPDVR